MGANSITALLAVTTCFYFSIPTFESKQRRGSLGIDEAEIFIAPLQKHGVTYTPSSKPYRHLGFCYFEDYSTYLRTEIFLVYSISKNTHIIPKSPWVGNSATEAVPLIPCD